MRCRGNKISELVRNLDCRRTILKICFDLCSRGPRWLDFFSYLCCHASQIADFTPHWPNGKFISYCAALHGMIHTPRGSLTCDSDTACSSRYKCASIWVTAFDLPLSSVLTAPCVASYRLFKWLWLLTRFPPLCACPVMTGKRRQATKQFVGLRF
jgi:hypothetical protein